jgi:hypothetical protein
VEFYHTIVIQVTFTYPNMKLVSSHWLYPNAVNVNQCYPKLECCST